MWPCVFGHNVSLPFSKNAGHRHLGDPSPKPHVLFVSILDCLFLHPGYTHTLSLTPFPPLPSLPPSSPFSGQLSKWSRCHARPLLPVQVHVVLGGGPGRLGPGPCCCGNGTLLTYLSVRRGGWKTGAVLNLSLTPLNQGDITQDLKVRNHMNETGVSGRHLFSKVNTWMVRVEACLSQGLHLLSLPRSGVIFLGYVSGETSLQTHHNTSTQYHRYELLSQIHTVFFVWTLYILSYLMEIWKKNDDSRSHSAPPTLSRQWQPLSTGRLPPHCAPPTL